ncbi:receptor-like protein 7 isoform X2 [Quercus robur]|uniref:receptor-like protein 7 isoform X2 n=1 Tax=Quercus robur TaxID=38942 RepID=UPI002162BCA2|nr:receptor-like protein 7 isoform X2 [Quercus robur]
MGRVPFFLIFFLFLSLPNSSLSSFSFNSSTPLCLSDQSSALLHFRNSFFVGDSDNNCDYPPKNSWKMGTNCCGWDGVTCDTMTGHVIAVDLSCSRLVGPIHPNSTLFSLRHLQRLNLAYNDFVDSTISSKFGGFANMTHLNLAYSSVAGNFPSEISHLSKLVSLDLTFNSFMRIETRSLKRLVQNLTHLTELVLDFVDMSSVSPNSFMNLSSSLTSLRLSVCGLKGRFPNNIFHLPNLQLLDLSYNNNLTGSLPTYNWSTPLKSLHLSGTEFPIDLPNSVSNLKSLKELYIGGCNFIGSSSPTFLSNLTQITSLDLSYNNFGGQFPWSLLNFEVLTYLDLSNNNFIGQLPDLSLNWTQVSSSNSSSSNSSSSSQSVSQIPSKLVRLSLSHNLLNGTIPSWLYDIPSLHELSLDNNRFTGQIDEFQHNSLYYLDLGNNNLHGHIPISIAKLVSLNHLNISFNNISGPLESSMFSKLKTLQTIDLSHNPLLSFSNYSIVDYTLPKLWDLHLSSCNISDFPDFIKSMESLAYLDLSNNQIKGNIPMWLLEVGKNLHVLDLSHNFLQGPLPIPPSSIEFFLVSRNNFSGNIPSLICNITFLNVLDLSHNHLSNMVPLCLGNFSHSLTVLDLRSNKLNGTIPATFAKGNYLRSLNLNDNQLEGLEVLDLGNNKISGTFPHWLESLPELRVLVLRSNKFHGAIANPKTKFSFPNLRIIDLSHNEFHGLLPTKYFNHFKAMMSMNANNGKLKYMGDSYYHDSVMVTMKGFNIEMVKIQNLFTTIDFSNNSFRGEIPKSIGMLKSLKGLNFSHNSLIGHMPPSMGNLRNLEWLDLSSNMLTGEIPGQLVDITSLEVLNLSENHLVGMIPRGNQFNTFENVSYFGNLGLCGFPLTRTCDNVEGQLPLPSLTIQDNDFKFVNWFHWKVVLLGYGCGFILGLGLGYLVLSSEKPKWLVNIVYGERCNMVQRSKNNAHGRTR